ncbi:MULTISPECIES: rhomboid-like protein [unclassified Streptomyces]|uniref:rhomboid-like protein n=1 Tax=Streptomyces sp. NPDC127532 TaxID=3345399 RepID=UPI00363DDA1C
MRQSVMPQNQPEDEPEHIPAHVPEHVTASHQESGPESGPEARPAGSRATTVRAARTALRRWITTAPGTYVWLAILFATTVVMHRMSPDFEEDFLRQRSTNIHELSQNPVRVLVSSALWIDGGRWLPYAVLFTVFHATAEHWLGTLRWLTVAAVAHVLATLVSEGVLAWAVRHGHAPQSSVNTLDIGVSYALAGVVAVLVYRVPRPWRHVYAFAVLVFYGIPLVTGRSFTDLGHFTAVLIGLACYPLTRHPHPRGPRTS